jgi:RimJ/RimL family protein N-acetyltransferase
MVFPEKYKGLKNNSFSIGEYSIAPIRYEDRVDIMQWRNEQMYHLRQAKPLTKDSQEIYFKSIVSTLFELETPTQLLFSYLKNGICIGYGGLVHISEVEQSAEVSFIMQTTLEKKEFELHWINFLKLIVLVAFQEMRLKKVFTYAYNIRPHLYPVLEKNKFILKSRLKNKIEIEGKQIDVLIHERLNPYYSLQLRESNENDAMLLYNWSSDPLVRSQSFNQEPIEFENHKKWFDKKLKNEQSLLLINEFEGESAGLIRFEVEKEKATIGVLIGEKFRGKGLASDMLIKSTQFYFSKFDKPIWAFIKESNQASIKSFSKAGFEFSHNTVVNEIPSLVYKL